MPCTYGTFEKRARGHGQRQYTTWICSSFFFLTADTGSSLLIFILIFDGWSQALGLGGFRTAARSTLPCHGALSKADTQSKRLEAAGRASGGASCSSLGRCIVDEEDEMQCNNGSGKIIGRHLSRFRTTRANAQPKGPNLLQAYRAGRF